MTKTTKAKRRTRHPKPRPAPAPKIENPEAEHPADRKLDRADKILKGKSRVDRWASACNKAILARSDLDDALEVLADLRGEFEEWRDAMPDNLHGSPVYEKLDAVCDLDIDRDAVMEGLDFLDEADGMDLPLGFGRD